MYSFTVDPTLQKPLQRSQASYYYSLIRIDIFPPLVEQSLQLIDQFRVLMPQVAGFSRILFQVGQKQGVITL